MTVGYVVVGVSYNILVSRVFVDVVIIVTKICCPVFALTDFNDSNISGVTMLVRDIEANAEKYAVVGWE